MSNPIQNSAPLQTNYLPPEFVNREDEQAVLQTYFSQVAETCSRNLHIYGPRGTGKTHLIHQALEDLPSQVNTCYIACSKHDTQYKALKQIFQSVSGEVISDGYHTSDLQRKIEKRTSAVQTMVVLDEIDFLLMNDGDSLLYFLSRIENSDNLSIITVSANYEQIPIEERTQSSLQPRRINFEQYTSKQVFEILLERAEDSLAPRTLQREAQNFIASTVSNIKFGLHWLRTAAEKSDDVITESVVNEVEPSAYSSYIEELLEPFTIHHRIAYQAIEELTQELEAPDIRSGIIYNRYRELCKSVEEDSLSDRRISDFLKHLELLCLIEAEYHYGGRRGKTRDIRLL